MDNFPYNRFSQFLKNKYGSRVYKIPVTIPCGCPNRDGTKGTGGCIFCGEEAAGFESLNPEIPVLEQLAANMDYMGKKYKADKFIAYFQNYSNTYIDFDLFKSFIAEACIGKVAAVYISTRPDCIEEKHAAFLTELSQRKNVDIVIEMGLQSANDKTLEILNRRHTVRDYADAAELLHKYNIPFCAHMITDIPFEGADQALVNARFLNDTKTAQVKCHSLYIIRDTKLGDMYENRDIKMLSCDDFIERTILFLRNLEENIIVQRLMGRAPEDRTVFCNYGRSWRAVVDEILSKMIENGWKQGDLIQLP